MEKTLLDRNEIGRRGRALYEDHIRKQVETVENIGKMVIMDVETGDFEIDTLGIEAAQKLRERHPDAHLFGMRIGYNVAESFGGVIERTAPK
jgi:hypothetical protein